MVIIRFLLPSLILAFSLLNSYAQEPEKKTIPSDTLQEEIIYEYDTVYLAPDTLHQTDTLFLHKLRAQLVKHPPKPQPRDFLAMIYGGGPQFYPAQTSFVSDSVKSMFQVSEACFLGVSFKPQKYYINIQAGFEHQRERLQLLSLAHYTIVRNNYTQDSAVVTGSGYYRNTFDYLSLEFSMGNKIRDGKYPVYLFGSLSYKKLIQYTSEHSASQTSSYINPAEVRKDNFYILFKPSVSNVISKDLEIFLSPYVGLNLFDSYLHPYKTRIITGLEINIKYFLKKM